MLLGSICALTLGLLSGPAPANAAVSNYCTGWQPVGGYCVGADRWLYQTYGWGDQGGVCVAVYEYPRACTFSANTGVYSPKSPVLWTRPIIWNNHNGSNFVHGVALQP